MKNTALIFITGIFCFSLGVILEYTLIQNEVHYPKVELSKKYKTIDSTDCLKGYFDKDSILNIVFDNKKYDYKLNLRKDYRVELIDSDNNIIQTTTLDSIPYYINEDNK